jgi:hypothetical protein
MICTKNKPGQNKQEELANDIFYAKLKGLLSVRTKIPGW